MMLNSVVLPEPLGPINPMRPRSGTAKLTLRSTERPPKLWPTASSRRMAASAVMRCCLAGGGLAPQEVEPAHQPARKPHHHGDQRQAEQDLVKIAETAEVFGQERDEQRADDGAEHRAHPAEHRNQQEAERFIDRKTLHADERGVMGKKVAGERAEER